jgi:predicted nucleic acid-binding protein
VNFGTFRGPVVVDTNVFGLNLRRTVLEPLYRPLVEARDLILSFVTVTELRYGARRANWGHGIARGDVLPERDVGSATG